MAKYIVKVHTLTGSGIVNEKDLKEGDIITDDHVSAEVAKQFIKQGWLEPVEAPAETEKPAEKRKENNTSQ